MNAEIILQEKADKYYVAFNDNQKKAILEAMRSFAKIFNPDDRLDKANMIINEVGKYFDLNQGYHKDKNRRSELVEARRISMYFIRKYTNMSLAKIGSLFNKDHTTVIVSLRQVSNFLQTEKDYQKTIIKLKLMLDEKLENLF